MDRRLLKSWWLPVAAALAAATALATDAETIPAATVVRFNTACTSCHEGECSGRLSFDSGAAAAGNHIERHAGSTDEHMLRDLYAILRHTKESCRQYPLPAPRHPHADWSEADLALWRDAAFGAYFIPLGEIGAGPRQVELEFAGPADGGARLADDHMDTVAEERLYRDALKSLALTAEPGMRYYLHLRTEATLRRLRIR